MKAVVLVGGEGTRMRPITETVPKPLVPFMNRPFLHHVLDLLAAHGVEEGILSSSYLEAEFEPFLVERRDHAPAVTWVTEERPLGTCGAITGAREHLDATFLVLNGDVLTDLDVTALVASHRRRGATATIALTPVEDARPYGLVETEGDGRVRRFREKPAEQIPGEVNAGTYVLEPSVIDGVPPEVPVSIERETFPALIEGGALVAGFTWTGYWRDLGTPAAYLAAHLDALEGRIGGPYARPLVGPGGEIDPGAALAELAVLGPRCRVGAGAKVERSVLHEGAVVGADATVEDSILGPGASVGRAATVRGSVLGAGAVIPAGGVLDDAKVAGASD
jgi:mannose-1-phosphate guanylyltransferase